MTTTTMDAAALAALDPGSAMRADLAALGLQEPLPPEVAERWGVWLQIAVVFDRLRRVPVRKRLLYARSTTPLWELARSRTGLDRFLDVRSVMEGWTGAAPPLSAFRSLLWAAEVVEGDGALRLGCVTLYALSWTVATDDVRNGYLIAQQARVIRTLGDTTEALALLERAAAIAERRRDAWLSFRVDLGRGAAHAQRGNYPAARQCFQHVIDGAEEGSELARAAHHGVMSAATAAGDYESAIRHGWKAFHGCAPATATRAEVLTALAYVARRVGRPRNALRAYRAALDLGLPMRRRLPALSGATLAAVECGEVALALELVELTRREIVHSALPFNRADALNDLGHAYVGLRRFTDARAALEECMSIARAHDFHELSWHADRALAMLESNPAPSNLGATAEVDVVFDVDIEQVLDELEDLPVGSGGIRGKT